MAWVSSESRIEIETETWSFTFSALAWTLWIVKIRVEMRMKIVRSKIEVVSEVINRGCEAWFHYYNEHP